MNPFVGFFMRFHFLFLRVTQNGSYPPPLSHGEEEEAFKLMRTGDREARKKLIEHNLRLVSHIVKKYYTQSKNQEDLISIGTIGLIKAVDSFNAENGARFATYASKCIQNEILMHFRSAKKTASLVSLNETIDMDKEGNPLTYMDVISIDDTIAEELDIKISGEIAMRIINSYLSEREKEIIFLRYGLHGGAPLTQRELAEKLNISRSYVSRIEKSALEKIRYRMLRKQI